MNVDEFYAESHRGNRFGVKGPLYGVGGHRGDDTNGWPLGTWIPSFVTGVVVRSVKYVSLGWVTTVQTTLDGRTAWVSWCHQYSPGPSVGTPVWLNSWVGPLGNSGTLTLGKHTHVVVSFTSPDPRSGAVVDPRPYINAAKAQLAGGGAVPIIEENRGRTMRTIKIVKSSDAAMNLAAWPVGGRYLVTDAGITAHPTSALGYGLANRVAGFEIAEDQECFGAEAQALLEMLHVINAPGGGSVGVSVADREAIAAEVIRQQKLPGN